MIKQLIFICFILFTFIAHAEADSSQTTHGWCSPAVSNVSQNVTIICRGVDPKAMARLNELLDIKDQQRMEKINEAEEWASKYRELKLRLESVGSGSATTENEAARLLKEGRLEAAGQLLDELLEEEDEILRLVASRNFNRAQVYALQFLYSKALPYYKKANKYEPDNLEYKIAYANALVVQHYSVEAEPHFLQALSSCESKINGGDTSYLIFKAKALKGLFEVTRQNKKDIPKTYEYLKSLVNTYRQLVKLKGRSYRFELAKNLILHSQFTIVRDFSDKSFTEAEKITEEAVSIFKELATNHSEKSSLYLAHSMGALLSLGILQTSFNYREKSRNTFSRVIAIHEKIGKDSSDLISVGMAGSFMNVAGVYIFEKRYKEAVEATNTAIQILEKKTVVGDEYYVAIPHLYIIQSTAYSRLYQREKELESLIKARNVTRKLVAHNPRTFEPMLMKIVERLMETQKALGNHEESAKASNEIREIQQKYYAKQLAETKAKSDKAIAAGAKFLEENKQKDGVITRKSGLQYKVIVKGKGKRPTKNSTIIAHYRGKLIDGTVFDSSYKRNQPATFPVNAVIKGWQEVLPLMEVGSKWKVFIPPELAYGNSGAGSSIGPNETLIFDVELIGIKK